MFKKLFFAGLALLSLNCKSTKTENNTNPYTAESDFTIAFGSCNKHNVNNVLWDDILAARPQIWIWGGDNVYADTVE